ncbi:MAG: methylenetetrahydrofolate reductase [Breznakiellaceae bacterium]|jgi:methylenetetrahydrofolate reductase (NADPH)
MRISLEIVPRNEDELVREAKLCEKWKSITHINIPDLLRFPLRSWEGAALLHEEKISLPVIPHLRAIDFDMRRDFPLKEFFIHHDIQTVLVIAGDPPQDMGRRVYPTKTTELIRKLKNELPSLTVYAAFDPYRANIRYELDYLLAKEDAGADGFMSQPFFDERLLEIYAEYLENKRVFWGISPVLSERSKTYWEIRNRAIFPKNFEPTLEWNVRFGKKVIAFCKTHGFDLYVMPIKVDLAPYLETLLG